MFNIFKELKKIMSQFLTDIDAKIDAIVVAHGTANNADLSNLKTEIMVEVSAMTDAQNKLLGQTQADLAAAQSTIATMRTSLIADEGVEESLVARVTDVETALTHVVNHLANDNPADAQAAAIAATQPAPSPNPAAAGAAGSSDAGTGSAGGAAA